MSTSIETDVAASFVDIVGDANVAPAIKSDVNRGKLPACIVTPGTEEELASVLQTADRLGLTVCVRGGGTKMTWGRAPQSIGVILSTRRLSRIVDHASGDMTVTVMSGCSIARLQQALSTGRQRLAVDPLWPGQATVGGVLACNDTGSLRERFGGLRDQLLGITVVLADGTIARSGGRVVKNVAGYDLPKLFVGSMGTLGVITEATFRLYSLPQAVRTVSFQLSTQSEIQTFLAGLRASTLSPTGLQIRASSTTLPQVDIRLEGSEAVLKELSRQLVKTMGTGQPFEPESDVWGAREMLFTGAVTSTLCKISLLPTHIAPLCDRLVEIMKPNGIRWSLVMQAIGIGFVRFGSPKLTPLVEQLRILRNEIETREGSLVLVGGSEPMEKEFDAWGPTGSSFPLMRRIKDSFDPYHIMCPGRFVGDI